MHRNATERTRACKLLKPFLVAPRGAGFGNMSDRFGASGARIVCISERFGAFGA